MVIHFHEIISSRKSVLNNRIQRLDQALEELNLSEAIEFSMAEIQEDFNPRKKGKKVGIESLNFLEDVKDPVVYIFQLCDPVSAGRVKEHFKNYRKNREIENKRAVSYLPTDIDDNESNILYVGSIKSYFHRRVKEHWGLGNYRTGALNMKYWMPDDIKLRLYFIAIGDKTLTYDIEASIAASLSPLVGKCEK